MPHKPDTWFNLIRSCASPSHSWNGTFKKTNKRQKCQSSLLLLAPTYASLLFVLIITPVLGAAIRETGITYCSTCPESCHCQAVDGVCADICCTKQELKHLPPLHEFPDKSLINRLTFESIGITGITRDYFDSFINVKTLDLGYNGISSITPDVFDSLQFLETLILTGNGLQTVPADFLSRHRHVRALYLDHNQLASLPVNFFDRFPQLELLALSGNAVVCDCHFQWLRDWLEFHIRGVGIVDVIDASRLTCPYSIDGHVSQVPFYASYFRCSEDDVTGDGTSTEQDAKLERSKRSSGRCYEYLQNHGRIHTENCDASDFGSCVLLANQWRIVEGVVLNNFITSQTECAAFCRLHDSYEAGFYDAPTTTCFCGSVVDSCDVTMCAESPGHEDGDTVCDRSYVPNGFQVSSAFNITGIAPFSTDSASTINLSSGDAVSHYVCQFGDGSGEYVSGVGGGDIVHQFFLPGSMNMTVSSSAFTDSVEVPVLVQDPPLISDVSRLVNVLGADAPNIELRVRSGSTVQVKWTMQDIEGSTYVDDEPCSQGAYSAMTESCYVLVEGTQSWRNASVYCDTHYRGKIAMLKSEAEHDFLVDNVLDASSDSGWWIGLSDSAYEGTWFWSDHKVLESTEYSNWAVGRPYENAAWGEEESQNSQPDAALDCVYLMTHTSGGSSDSDSSDSGDIRRRRRSDESSSSPGNEAGWYDEDCTSEKPFVCQYPAWETYNVPKYFAGVPVTISGSDAVLAEVEESEMTQSDSSVLYLSLGSWFSANGSLESWIFEAASVESATEVHFQVYRPSCASDLQLVTAGCSGAPYSYCSANDITCTVPDDACASGYVYCYLTSSCLPPTEACTCLHSAASCHPWDSATMRLANYTLVAETVTVLPAHSSGPIRLRVQEEVEIHSHDIMALQIADADNLPVTCEDLSHDNASLWRNQSHVAVYRSDWVTIGDTVTNLDQSATWEEHQKCNIASLYTQPVTVNPPVNLTGLANQDALYSFSVEVFNKVSNSSIASRPPFLDVLSMLEPCNVSGYDDLCVLPTREHVIFLVRMTSVTYDYTTLSLNYTNTNSSTFQRDCPRYFANSSHCVPEVGSVYDMYALLNVTFTRPEDVTLALSACTEDNMCVSLVFDATLQRRLRVRSIQHDHIYAGVETTLIANCRGEPLHLTWNVTRGENTTIYEFNITRELTLTFALPGEYLISVNASNVLGYSIERDTIYALDFFNGTNVTAQFPPIAAFGYDTQLHAYALFAPYNLGHFEFATSDGSASEFADVIHTQPDYRFIRGTVLHAFQALNEVSVNVTLSDPSTDNGFFGFAEGVVIVWHPIENVTVIAEPNPVETGFNVTYNFRQINGTGNMTYEVNFSDGTELYIAETPEVVGLTHAFETSGEYNVTASASNIVTDYTSQVSISVQDRIQGLELHYNGPIDFGNIVVVTATITNGTDVVYEFLDGTSESPAVLQQSHVFSVNYSLVGNYSVTVTARNGINEMNASISAEVRDWSPFVFHGITHEPCVGTVNATFRANISYHNYEWLLFTWQFSDGVSYSGTGLERVEHSFAESGSTWVSLQIVSVVAGAVPMSTVNNTHVCVQEEVGGLAFSHAAENVGFDAGSVASETFAISVSQGSDYTVTWTYFGESHETNSLSETVEFSSIGQYTVEATVQNAISSRSVSVSVALYENIGGITVFYNEQDFSRGGSIETTEAFSLHHSASEGSSITWNITIYELDSGIMIDQRILTPHDQAVYNHSTGVGQPTQWRYHINASNPVDSEESTLTIHFQDSITEFAVYSSIAEVMMSEDVLFETSYATGSSVLYSWVIKNSDEMVVYESLDSPNSTLLWSQSTADYYTVSVTAHNDVSEQSDSIGLQVWRVYDVTIETSADYSPYVATNEPTVFSVSSVRFASPAYMWEISDPLFDTSQATSEAPTHNFTSPGVYRVAVTMTEHSNRAAAEMNMFARFPIAGLILEVESSTFFQDDIVSFYYGVEQGTNVTYSWSVIQLFENSESSGYDGAEIQAQSDNVTTLQFETAGTFHVTLLAENIISSAEESVTVIILRRITGLEIVDCCDFWVTGQEMSFRATVDTGSSVEYTWYIGNDVEMTGQEVSYTFDNPGNYSINVTAENALSSQTVHENMTVLSALAEVIIERDRDQREDLYYYQEPGVNITFEAVVTGDQLGPLFYRWFINSTEQEDSTESTLMRLFSSGIYRVRVEVENVLGDMIYSVDIFQVQELLCDPPVQNVIGDSERTELKSNNFKIEVRVQACDRYTTMHTWTAYVSSCDSGNVTDLPSGMSRWTPTLTFAERSMDYGTYCLTLKSSYLNTPEETTIDVILHVNASALVAVIDGGSARTLTNSDPCTIDGSPSYDPDFLENEHLEYTWICHSNSSDSETENHMQRIDYCHEIESETSPVIEVDAGRLLSNHEYNITLVVSAAGRQSGVTTQIIMVLGETVPVVSISCVSCRESNIFTISSSQHIKLIGTCTENCVRASYRWEVTRVADRTVIHLNDTSTSTGVNRPNLSIRENVLENDQEYKFSLYVNSFGTTAQGYASLSLEPSTPPSGGFCNLTVQRNPLVALEDTFTVDCDDWEDNSRILATLIYHIYVVSGDDWYPIYRGTSPTVTSYLSVQEETRRVKIYVEVIDSADTSTLALEQWIRVVSPIPPANVTRTEHITEMAMVGMQSVRTQNDPKALLQYMIAVSLQLNVESSLGTGSSNDVVLRENLRREMLYILNETATIAAIDDIQQVAYLIRLITTHLEEFPVELDMFEISLQLMDTIVQSLIDEVSPAMTGEEFVPHYMVTSVSNLMEIILLELFSTLSPADSAIIRLQKMAVDLTSSVVYLALQTQVLEEQPISYDTGYISISGQRVLGSSIQTEFGDGTNEVDLPFGLMDDFRNSELFQVMMSFRYNPYTWGFEYSSPVTSHALNIYFTHTNGTEVTRSDLDEDKLVKMKIEKADIPTSPAFTGGRRRRDTSDENDSEVTCVVLKPDEIQESKVDISSNLIPDRSSIHINVTAEPVLEANETFDGNLLVTVYLGKGYSPTNKRNHGKVELTSDYPSGEFFIVDDFTSDEKAQNYMMVVENGGRDDVIVSFALFATTCQFYSNGDDMWVNDGCEPSQDSTVRASLCSCDHMTMFASSVLVSPAELKFRDIPKLDVKNNPVVLILVCVFTFLYVVMVTVCRRWDLHDKRRVSVVPFCGLDGPYKYEVTVVTGKRRGAGTSAHVGINVIGASGKSGPRLLEKLEAFQRGCVDTFCIASEKDLGDIKKIRIWHDNMGVDTPWYLSRVIIRDLQENKTYYFLAKCWLTLEEENGSIEKWLSPADDKEKKKFTNILAEETTKGLTERHLWISLLERPARSRFTRVQRATCCLAVLFLYMFLNAMFYGLLHQPDDFDSVSSARYFQWLDVLVGIIACLLTFPVAVLLVQLFKRIRQNELSVTPRPSTGESVEMDAFSDVMSRNTSASTHGRRQPQILRLPSNLSNVSSSASELPSKPGRLIRTSNMRVQTAKSNSSDGSGKESMSEDLWSADNIMEKWDLKDNGDPGATEQSKVHGHAGTRLKPARFVPATRQQRAPSSDSIDDFIDELDEIEQLYGGDTAKPERLNSRKDPSLLNVSMGSLGNVSHEDTTVSCTSLHHAGRQRKISQFSRDSLYGESIQEEKFPEGSEERKEDIEFKIPIQTIDGLQPGYAPGLSSGEPPVQRLTLPYRPKPCCELPYWCIYLAYGLCAVLYVVSLVCTLLYGHEFQQDIAMKWLLAFFISFLNSFFILEPLKLIVIALVLAKITNNIEECEDKLEIPPVLEGNEKIKDIKMRPLAGYSLLQAKEEGKKVTRMRSMLYTFILFMLFLLIVLILNYASYNWLGIYLHRRVNSTFTVEMYNDDRAFRHIRGYGNFWDWMEQVAAPGVHAQELHLQAEYGYVLGKAVLRQKRSLDVGCQATKKLDHFNADHLVEQGCYGDPGWEEDTGSYGIGWDSENGGNRSWSYQTQRSVDFEGQMGSYTSGGFIQDLGSNYAETLDIISALKSNDWIDRATRLVLLEFTTYSANTALFAVVTFAVEFPVSSSALPSYKIDPVEITNHSTTRASPYMISEILLFLVLIYLVVILILKLKSEKWDYFKSFSNWVNLLLLGLTLASIALYVTVVIVCTSAYDAYLDKQNAFTSFSAAAYWIREWKNVNAVLLFVLMLVVVYQMRFIKFFAKFIKTLQAAKWEVLAMGFFFVAFLCYYSQLGYLWFGTVTYAMRSFGAGFVYTLTIFRGLTPFIDAMMFYDHAFTACFYISFIFLMFVYIFGTILAALNSAYKTVKSQMYYHNTVEMEDYEMIDFMIKRLKKWMKITKEKPKGFRKVKFQGLPSISSRESSTKSYRSLGPPGSYTSTTSSDLSMYDDLELLQIYNASMVKRANDTWQKVLDKLNEVITLDKEETKLETKLESHCRKDKERREKERQEEEARQFRRQQRLRRQQRQISDSSDTNPRCAYIDTSSHDVISSAHARASDAQRARQQWQTTLVDEDRDVPGDGAQIYQTQSPLDPDIIISKPPSGPPSIYHTRRRQPELSTSYEPSFAAVGKGIGLSKFQKPGNSAPAQPVSTTPRQPVLSPRARRFGVGNASVTSASDIRLSHDDSPSHRRLSSIDLPWFLSSPRRVFGNSSDQTAPTQQLGANSEDRRRRPFSLDRSRRKRSQSPTERRNRSAWEFSS